MVVLQVPNRTGLHRNESLRGEGDPGAGMTPTGAGLKHFPCVSWLVPTPSHVRLASQSLSPPPKAVSQGSSDSQILDLSNRFYTLIPHDFGMKKPPLLNNADSVQVVGGSGGRYGSGCRSLKAGVVLGGPPLGPRFEVGFLPHGWRPTTDQT